MKLIRKNKNIILISGISFILTWALIISFQATRNDNNKKFVTINQETFQLASAASAGGQGMGGQYVPLVPDVDLTGGAGGGAATYLENLYKWGISFAVVLSIISIIFGGITYMTTDAISGKTDGKARITGALIGLILALGSYLILHTINPQLISLSRLNPESIADGLNPENITDELNPENITDGL